MIFSYSAWSKSRVDVLRYDNIRLLSYYQTIIDSINYQNISIFIGLDRAKVCYFDIPYHDTNCNCNYQNLRTLIPLHCVKRHAIWIHNESMQISQP